MNMIRKIRGGGGSTKNKCFIEFKNVRVLPIYYQIRYKLTWQFIMEQKTKIEILL